MKARPIAPRVVFGFPYLPEKGKGEGYEVFYEVALRSPRGCIAICRRVIKTAGAVDRFYARLENRSDKIKGRRSPFGKLLHFSARAFLGTSKVAWDREWSRNLAFNRKVSDEAKADYTAGRSYACR